MRKVKMTKARNAALCRVRAAYDTALLSIFHTRRDFEFDFLKDEDRSPTYDVTVEHADAEIKIRYLVHLHPLIGSPYHHNKGCTFELTVNVYLHAIGWEFYGVNAIARLYHGTPDDLSMMIVDSYLPTRTQADLADGAVMVVKWWDRFMHSDYSAT